MNHAKMVKKIAKVMAKGGISTVVTPNQPDMIYVRKKNGKKYLIVVRDLND